MDIKNALSIAGRTANIQESSGRRSFYLDYGQNQIPSFHKKIIVRCDDDAMLPMTLIENSEHIRIYYDFTGCIQVPDLLKQRSIEGLPAAGYISYILSSAIRCVTALENRLFRWEFFPVIPDAIFVDMKTGHVKLVYIPYFEELLTMQERLMKAIRDTGELSKDEEWIAYGEEICNKIRYGNLGLAEIALLFEESVGGLDAKGWPVRNAMTIREAKEGNKENESPATTRKDRSRFWWK